MRALWYFLVGIVVAALVVAFGTFVVQNPQVGSVYFMGNSAQSDLGSLVASAAVLGFLVALLVLLPGRLAGGLRTSAFERQARRLEEDLAALRERYAQLEGDHHRLLDEHRELVSHVGAAHNQTRTPLAGGAAYGQAQAQLTRPGPIVPSPSRSTSASTADQSTSPAERLRALYYRPQARLWAQYDRLRKRLRRRRAAPDDRTGMPHRPISPAA